jgi:uncharacterized lipoprotein YajG
MNKFFYVAAMTAMLIGCATHPQTGKLTAPVADSLDKVQDNLSRVDGKAVIVENYLKKNCK